MSRAGHALRIAAAVLFFAVWFPLALIAQLLRLQK